LDDDDKCGGGGGKLLVLFQSLNLNSFMNPASPPKSVILPRLISGFLSPPPRNTLGRTSVLMMGGCDFIAFSKKVQGTNSKEVLSLLELKKLRNSQTNFQNGQTFCVSFLVVESVSCSSSSRISKYGFYLLGMCRI
jgi:hypothetical protein